MKDVLTKQEFANAVKNEIFLTTDKVIKVDVVTETMNNGTKSDRIIIGYSGTSGLSIRMEESYEKFRSTGGDINVITECAKLILQVLEQQIETANEIAAKLPDVRNYEAVKPMLTLRLVNSRLNQERLAGRPHIPYLDLEIIFYIEIDRQGTEIRSTAVLNQLFEMWGVSLEQMYQDALENMKAKYPAILKPMSELIKFCSPDTKLFVLSNHSFINGAVSILYPGMLESCAEELGGDFFIIPSSIHELLLFKRNENDAVEQISMMIQDVNQNHVAPENLLSDHPYLYSVKDRKIVVQQ